MNFDNRNLFYNKIHHKFVVIKVSSPLAINTLTFKACVNGWGKLSLPRI